MPVARVPCGLFMVFCLVECSLSACFCLALQVSGPSFHSPQPRSLSLCSFLLQPSHLWGLFLVGSGVCLGCHRSSCCPSPSFLWHACWYPSVPVRLSSGLLFPTFLVGSSSSGFPLAPFQSVFLVLSGALVGLPGSLLCLPPGYGSSSFSVPCGLVGASATFPAALRLASLWPLGYSTVSSLGVSSMCAFLDSKLLCSLAS